MKNESKERVFSKMPKARSGRRRFFLPLTLGILSLVAIACNGDRNTTSPNKAAVPSPIIPNAKRYPMADHPGKLPPTPVTSY